MSESFDFNAVAATFLDDSVSVASGEIVLGVFSAIDAEGNPLVSYAYSGSTTCVALSTVATLPQQIGRQVALSFVNGDLRKPIIIGFIHKVLNDLLDNFVLTPSMRDCRLDANTENVSAQDGKVFADDIQVFENPLPMSDLQQTANVIRVDGKKVVIEGEEEVVLKCGDASITLTKAGKVLIRGKYLVSRSSGINRILGGSVSLN